MNNINNSDNTAISTFNFNDFEVRTTLENDKIYFCLSDIRNILGIPQNSRLIQDLSKGFVKSELLTNGGKQEVYFCNERDLYKITLRSNSPVAELFQDWVCGEVLPSIHRYGAYLTPSKIEEVLLDPDTIIRLAIELKKEREEKQKLIYSNDELRTKIKTDRPLVTFAESVQVSKTSILIGELAKILKQNGVDIGQNRLFEILRNEEYLGKKGEYYNLPTQKAMNLGLFEIAERTINNPDGSVKITKTTKVSGKGQIYFVNKFVNDLNKAITAWEYLGFDKRIGFYTKDNMEVLPNGNHFASGYFCKNLLPERLIFEKLEFEQEPYFNL
jgi:anti-repressor protein